MPGVATPRVVFDAKGKWLPSLLAVALSATAVREPLLAGLQASGRTLEGHVPLLVKLLEDGMCNPGDGSYAEKAVAAHAANGIDGELIGLVWAACVILPLKSVEGDYDEFGPYFDAAYAFGERIGAPEDYTEAYWNTLETKVVELARDLGRSNVDPGAITAFWGLIRHPYVRGQLGDKSQGVILAEMLDLLPGELVTQFSVAAS